MPATAASVALSVAAVSAQSPALTTWNELRNRRTALPSLHQEFNVEQTVTWSTQEKRASKRVDTIDVQGTMWRQTIGPVIHGDAASGDGRELFDIDGSEVVRLSRKDKDRAPAPAVYDFESLDLSKLVVAGQRPCGYTTNDRPCVVFDVRMKDSTTQSLSGLTRIAGGASRLVFDSETGVLVARTYSQPVSRERDRYRVDMAYTLAKVSYDRSPASLFSLSSDLHEVKKFTPWDAKRMNKTLSGKPAPELSVTTLEGTTVSLASLKGKTVLLDFWATWCPPCRVDAPALDRLHAKYGSQLAIVGISVNETREIVETFLKKSPLAFPVVLTTENEMPRPYDVSVFPTYMILDADGNFETAVEGDKGFDGLRGRLKKAGLEVD